MFPVFDTVSHPHFYKAALIDKLYYHIYGTFYVKKLDFLLYSYILSHNNPLFYLFCSNVFPFLSILYIFSLFSSFCLDMFFHIMNINTETTLFYTFTHILAL